LLPLKGEYSRMPSLRSTVGPSCIPDATCRHRRQWIILCWRPLHREGKWG
jgi:hypothetical protein